MSEQQQQQPAARWQAEQVTAFETDYHGAMGGIFDLSDDVKKIVGDLVAGDAFIYLFRRFGYPRFGWDGLKDLVRYYVTTPMEGVLLTIKPNVTGGGTFGYMLREDIDTACEEEELKPYHDWNMRCEVWTLKEHGIEIIKMFEQDDDKLCRMWNVWKVDKEERDFTSEKDVYNAFFIDQEAIRVKYVDQYKKIEPYPKLLPIEERGEDSIIKQCHAALCAAIRDMLRPVYVRDVLIDIRGEVRWDETLNQDEDAVMYAARSGCGVGDKLDEAEQEQGADA